MPGTSRAVTLIVPVSDWFLTWNFITGLSKLESDQKQIVPFTEAEITSALFPDAISREKTGEQL